MVGPYATLRLSEHVFWQVRGAWGQSSNDIKSILTSSDNFSSTRWLASTTLSGRWTDGAWTFRPAASVSFMEDIAQSYIGLYGVGIPDVSSRLGQAKVGPEWSVRMPMSPDLVIEPRFGAQVIWNFASDVTSQGAAVGGEAALSPGVRGRTEIGVGARSANGTLLDVAGSYDGIGSSNYTAVTVKGTVLVPLN